MKRILEGHLFPMNALGYYAVSTGKDNTADSIESIRACEERFFAQSKLIKDGIFLSNQATKRNLILAVNECLNECKIKN